MIISIKLVANKLEYTRACVDSVALKLQTTREMNRDNESLVLATQESIHNRPYGIQRVVALLMAAEARR